MKVLISTMALTVASACKPASEAKPPLEAKEVKERSTEAKPPLEAKEVKESSAEAKPPLEGKKSSAEAKPHFEVKEVRPSKFQVSEGGGKDEALIAECAKWKLTKEQARRFFQISNSYKENPYSEFYQLPCSIEGVVQAEGRTWEFTINAGATAVWRSGKEVRYFGCSAPACEPLVLMMPDGMEP
ncbi:hypothetical protein [Archangium sp.]|uniref:hypothetical protein n=1 Tax=Archangium sp. TaxID=1872627 RepID=UPI003899BDBD